MGVACGVWGERLAAVLATCKALLQAGDGCDWQAQWGAYIDCNRNRPRRHRGSGGRLALQP